ncbi:phenylalanine--tRNA ligase subunit beta [soil metagenome]
MNISYRWLRDLAPGIPDSPQGVAERLAMLGAPVDEIVELGADLGDVIIARVDEVRQHPNADRLRVCTVDAGTGATLQVVCGAPNVKAGGFYPFAPVGATLPGDVQIRKAKLRGEASEGMLCSARELGLGRDHAGLMTLAGEWEPGARFVEALEMDDARLVVDVTPNRPDLLSHLGIAREVAPGGVAEIALPPFDGVSASPQPARAERQGEVAGIRVAIDDVDGCPRYMAAVIRGLRVGPSPEWLATRLRVIGLRPINNVVDATNYVLHELGQPLHAFDLARLRGGEVRIRHASEGETLRTLDGVERTLVVQDLVIADAEGPIALAGVMGGADSEVSDKTTELLIECARFDPRSVRRTARRLALSTDASYRFERGVDPEGLPWALNSVVDLIVAVAGGTPEAALDVGADARDRTTVVLNPERVNRTLGVSLNSGEIAGYLRPLGFETVRQDGALNVQVPSFRSDVETEIDLIEEIARRRGYDTFVGPLPAFRPSVVPTEPQVTMQARVHAILGRWGFLEARTAGFAPAAPERVPLRNPLSAEESSLRDALLPGLLRRVEHNLARGVRDVRLYEIGTVFLPAQPPRPPREEIRLAAVFTGARQPGHWTSPGEAWTVWDVKGVLEDFAFGLGGQVAPEGERFQVRGGDGGVLGGGGPVPAAALDVPAWTGPVWGLEITIPPQKGQIEAAVYRPLPTFPAVERDLALLLPSGVAAGEVDAAIRSAAGPALEALFPFDLFAGTGIPEGTRSVAWRLRFRTAERTLTDAEVDAAINRTLKTLEDQFGIRRR